MTDQQELSAEFNYNYEDAAQRLAAERYLEAANNEKSPQALRVFVIGKHLEMLRNEVIQRKNEQ